VARSGTACRSTGATEQNGVQVAGGKESFDAVGARSEEIKSAIVIGFNRVITTSREINQARRLHTQLAIFEQTIRGGISRILMINK
jgi:hypothetical protein